MAPMAPLSVDNMEFSPAMNLLSRVLRFGDWLTLDVLNQLSGTPIWGTFAAPPNRAEEPNQSPGEGRAQD